MIACCAIAMVVAVMWWIRSLLLDCVSAMCRCTVVEIQCSQRASALKKRGAVLADGERYGGAALIAPAQHAACCARSPQECDWLLLEERGVEGAEPPLPPLPLPPRPPLKLFSGL